MEQYIEGLLRDIQQKLKAPKNQFNKFGNYKYRNCEDILEAVKPLLPQGYICTVSDDIQLIGDRYYVKATARFAGAGKEIVVTAFARENETQKGMNEAQITGSASSYARKYALNGLFAIDDTKDADSKDNSGSGQQEKKPYTPQSKSQPGTSYTPQGRPQPNTGYAQQNRPKQMKEPQQGHMLDKAASNFNEEDPYAN